MTKKKAARKAASAAGASEDTSEEPRTVLYVVNRAYSAGEAPEIVEARVVLEYEDEEDLLRLRLVGPPRGVEEDQKRVRRSDDRALGTWFEPPAPAETSEEVAE